MADEIPPAGGGTVLGEMYRFLLTPRWLAFHLLCLLGIAGMVMAGLWQHSRHEYKRELQALVEANADAPPVALDALVPADAMPDDPRLADLVWRRVVASGTYLPDERISIYHRSQNGAAGSFLVTPLQLDDGRVLLVVRGFYPLHTTPGELPAAPEGRVEVLGRIRTTEGRDAAHPDVERLLETRIVDVERLGRQLPGPVVPVYVELVDSDPPQPVGYPDPVPLVAPGLGNHLSYMVQWFIFATCVLTGWVFAVRRSAQQQRAKRPPPAASASASQS